MPERFQVAADNNLGAVPSSPTTNLTLNAMQLLRSTLATDRQESIGFTQRRAAERSKPRVAASLTIGGAISGRWARLTKGRKRQHRHPAQAPNSYGGGLTTIAGGTLQVGNGARGAKLGTGSVSDNGVLVFLHNDIVNQSRSHHGNGFTHAIRVWHAKIPRRK